MTEPTLIDLGLSLFVLAVVIGVPIVIYGLFETWLKSRQADKDTHRQLPVIKTVRRSY
jgi:hypothetical protein